MKAKAAGLIAELRHAGTRLRAAHEKNYLKSQAVFYGVTVPKTRQIARSYAAPLKEGRNLAAALQLAAVLWQDGAHESKMAATFVMCECGSFYDDRVWNVGTEWLGDIDNWALCDGIGPGMLSPFLRTGMERHRSRRQEVVRWTRSANPWMRRGALLCTLGPTRHDHEWEFLSRVALPLVEDPDYFVQKGLGWMLRESAHHHPREVITFVQEHRDRMRKSTVTNAVSRLPKTLQKAARTGSSARPGRVRQ
jgi:3-methyladenine DNA glycosylase AlkD